MISPLHTSEFPDLPNGIVAKINELAEAINTISAPKKLAPQYTEQQQRHIDLVAAGATSIERVAEKWGVAFYDDVSHEFTSPVYCVQCISRAQSLLDRMLLDPNKLYHSCEGCIDRVKWG